MNTKINDTGLFGRRAEHPPWLQPEKGSTPVTLEPLGKDMDLNTKTITSIFFLKVGESLK